MLGIDALTEGSAIKRLHDIIVPVNDLVKSDAGMSNPDRNRLAADDRAVHDWYRFVLSFPPHLVREYLTRFEVRPDQRVLDPFCGAPRGALWIMPEPTHRERRVA